MAHHQTATTASGALGIVLAARVPVLLWSAPGTEKTATITRGGHMSVATALSNWLMYRTVSLSSWSKMGYLRSSNKRPLLLSPGPGPVLASVQVRPYGCGR